MAIISTFFPNIIGCNVESGSPCIFLYLFDILFEIFDIYSILNLFKHISLHIDFIAPRYDREAFDVCYWEGILSMMNNVNSITGELKKPEEDALYDSYLENQWVSHYNKENKEYQVQKTIKPFLKPLGRLILDIKIREAQVKEARENGTLNSGYW